MMKTDTAYPQVSIRMVVESEHNEWVAYWQIGRDKGIPQSHKNKEVAIALARKNFTDHFFPELKTFN
jgi:hypothetical protein